MLTNEPKQAQRTHSGKASESDSALLTHTTVLCSVDSLKISFIAKKIL